MVFVNRYVVCGHLLRWQMPFHYLFFYMDGILAVIKTWIWGNCEDNIAFFVKIISERIYKKER